MKFIETIRNIFKIEDLRNRILYTMVLLLIYRLGSHVVLPGIDPVHLGGLAKQTSGGIMSLLDMFSGGAFSNASIFALGVMPYISASIIIQLLGMMVPYFQRLQREGESGRNKMNQITRYLTLIVLILQGTAYFTNLKYQSGGAFMVEGPMFFITTLICLMAGSMFVMWLGERITDRGIGNGISVIIMIGIVARLPFALIAEWGARTAMTAQGGLVLFIVELLLLFLVFIVTIALVQAVRKIPVQYAKRIVGNRQYGGVRQYIPLKINAAGVMPIIFAQVLMMLPMLFRMFDSTAFIADVFSDIAGFWYNFVFALLVVAFTYFYTALSINPMNMAEEIKRNNGFIPGIKPGKHTAQYLDKIMSYITLPGSIFLAIIAILPAFVMQISNINQQFAHFFGGTSLLILVGVVLDTLQQVEAHLLSRHYDGLMKTGRLKGRSGM